jgi:ribokinase
VVGSANADLVLDIDHRPAAGETIMGSDITTLPGGKGANQAVAAGKLGARVAFLGCLGPDAHADLLRTGLQEAGVDVSAIYTVAAPTGTAIIMITPDGNNSIVVAPGANRHLTVEVAERSRALWTNAGVLVMQLEIPLLTVAHLAREAARAGVRVVLNAAPAAPLSAETLAACDPLVVNETEATALIARVEDAPITADVVTALLDRGPRSVVVTLGAEGALVATAHAPHDVIHVPAERVAAIDTTGAGDAFVGAIAAALAKGQALQDAVRWASRVAALSVTRRGAQASYPFEAELVPTRTDGVPKR